MGKRRSEQRHNGGRKRWKAITLESGQEKNSGIGKIQRDGTRSEKRKENRAEETMYDDEDRV